MLQLFFSASNGVWFINKEKMLKIFIQNLTNSYKMQVVE